jgi:hypothetical protein
MNLNFSLFGYGISLQLAKKVVLPIDRLGPKMRRTSIVNNHQESERNPTEQDTYEKRLKRALKAGH